MKYDGYASLRRAAGERRDWPNSQVDPVLLFVVVTMAMLGLVIVYAATFHRGGALLKWHFGRAAGGLLALWLGYKLDYHRWEGRGFRLVLLLAMVVVLVLTLTLGNVWLVTRRALGFLQPAEFVKYALLFWLASYFSGLRADSDREWSIRNSFVKPGLVVIGVVGLTLLQPAVGTSLIMFASSLAVFYVAGVNRLCLLATVLLVVTVAVGALLVIPRLQNTKYAYVYKRWRDFASGETYHQKHSLIAHGSGGLFGRGLGEGREKYYFLPQLHKDFIFASVGEELGFVGCLGVMLLYLFFLLRGLRIGRRARSPLGTLVATGVTVTIVFYAFVHIAVTLSLIPTTGQPLPFISYGGSALVANLLAAGVLLKVSKYQTRGDDDVVDRGGWDRGTRLSRVRAGH
uniref:Probable peptidoglycan glycosyltransferase FtsW n=1 Tax=candidate division WOR-3 bacterium TaxID=2052148 RepID=A0A7C4CCE7_UNCW3